MLGPVVQIIKDRSTSFMHYYIFIVLVNICSFSPCLNNGSCAGNKSTGYLCTCRPGYTGPLVDQVRNKSL